MIGAAPRADVHAPLLSAAEIAEIAALAGQGLPLPAPPQVHDHHAGDWPSARLGRGLDFEEARAYSPGDDVRDMDWRSTARLGHPFIKIYREERQPGWHLVVDRAASMRFGTRRRLKVTQAARLALLVAFVAAERNAALGATLWDEPEVWLPPRHGRAGLLSLVRMVNAACPPVASAPHLASVAQPAGGERDRLRLLALAAELPRASRVWLLSDFAWLTPDHLPALARLAARVELQAVRITDPAEHALPELGPVQFEDLLFRQSRWVDTAQARVRDDFVRQQALKRAAQDALFARCGLRAMDLSTSSDTLVAQARGHG